ncbi:uncharacterized protein LY89DRAFT_730518 [Mollisia scopiformis]|uniref:DUF7881 domain-containing protein n=1 Tax=Mollisia scopiformis TaxID=149040 RepID=A0A194XK17_MOLSC|nr:uncharacterized protein LY89DRAFT_730518 [Mollisia scopiformis]KUJ20481.1 hypothetical protein LY89DRAFT_730518 [Mollisia scopiformis]
MSSSSPHSSSGSSSHADSLQQLENNIIKEQEDTVSHPKDILSQPEDALPLHETTLSHLADILSQPKDSTMTSSDRSKHRNVHIFNANDRNTTISGLIFTEKNNDTNCVTNANFYAMLQQTPNYVQTANVFEDMNPVPRAPLRAAQPPVLCLSTGNTDNTINPFTLAKRSILPSKPMFEAVEETASINSTTQVTNTTPSITFLAPDQIEDDEDDEPRLE